METRFGYKCDSEIFRAGWSLKDDPDITDCNNYAEFFYIDNHQPSPHFISRCKNHGLELSTKTALYIKQISAEEFNELYIIHSVMDG